MSTPTAKTTPNEKLIAELEATRREIARLREANAELRSKLESSLRGPGAQPRIGVSRLSRYDPLDYHPYDPE